MHIYVSALIQCGETDIMITHAIYLHRIGYFFRFSTNRPLANPFLIYYTRFHPRCYIPQNPPLVSFALTPEKKAKRKFIAFLVHKSFGIVIFFSGSKTLFFAALVFFTVMVRLFAVTHNSLCFFFETPYSQYGIDCLCLRAIHIIIFYGISVNTQSDIVK